MEACSEVVTAESVDEILCCDHSNKTFTAVLLHGNIFFFQFLLNELWNFLYLFFNVWELKG